MSMFTVFIDQSSPFGGLMTRPNLDIFTPNVVSLGGLASNRVADGLSACLRRVSLMVPYGIGTRMSTVSSDGTGRNVFFLSVCV